MQEIRVIIVEDNAPYAKMLSHVLDLNPNFTCSGIFKNAEDFLESINKLNDAVDVILLDLQLPGKDGLSLIPITQQKLSSAKILILTQNDNYLKTLEAIRLGVFGYILKGSTRDFIEQAIVDVHEGGCVLDSQLCKCVLDVMGSKVTAENLLSKREHQILELLAIGYSKKEVAEHLSISYRTVAQGTERIYKKLQVPNIAAAVAKAIRKGIL